MPDCSINCNKPTVFKEIVFPPAFGPEITIILVSCLSSIVCGCVTSFFCLLFAIIFYRYISISNSIFKMILNIKQTVQIVLKKNACAKHTNRCLNFGFLKMDFSNMIFQNICFQHRIFSRKAVAAPT
jgi:hypothetical protein